MATSPKVKPIKIIVTEDKVRRWTELRKNVLLIGTHGIGKSEIVKYVWEKLLGMVEGTDWKYLSASTLDPWIDFIGIPNVEGNGTLNADILLKVFFLIEQVHKHGMSLEDAKALLKADISGEKKLTFVQPSWIKTVKYIFLDEFSRSHAKVRNGLMEMIQFKSINGSPLPNLVAVWGAINPHNDEDFKYDVDQLDDAQQDRYHLHIYMSDTPSASWFSQHFKDPNLGGALVNWWSAQPEKARKHMSPRRLEYAVQHIIDDGDPREVIPDAICEGANAKELEDIVKNSSPILQNMKDIYREKDTHKAVEFLADERNWFYAKAEIMRTKAMMNFFVPCLPEEKIASLMASDKTVFDLLVKFAKDSKADEVLQEKVRDVFDDVLETTADTSLKTRITTEFADLMDVPDVLAENPNKAVFQYKTDSQQVFANALKKVVAGPPETPSGKMRTFSELRNCLPSSFTPVGGVKLAFRVLEAHIFGQMTASEQSEVLVKPQHWGDVMGFINKLVKDLVDAGCKVNDVRTEYPGIWKLCLLGKKTFYYAI